MWVRNHLKCHICEKVTDLRVQIPDKEKLRVRFPCHNCETELGGELSVDFKEITYDFAAERGDLIDYDPSVVDFYVEISDTLPTKKPSIEPHSPTLPTFRLKNLWETKVAKDLKVIVKDEDWESLKDLFVAYRNLNKKAIKKITSDLLPKFGIKIPDFEKEIEYHIAFFNCINHVIEHWLNINFDAFVQYLKNEVYSMENRYFSTVSEFFMSNLSGDYLNLLRSEFCDLAIRFIENRASFLYIYKNEITDDDYISNENFVTLKNFFTDCFETLGKHAHLIFGLQNIIERGDKDSVPDGVPSDIISAESLSNKSHGNKLEILEISDIAEFEKIYSPVTFDHRLRNGINHQKAFLNKKEQLISYYPITRRPNEEFTISYNDFLKKTLSSFSAVYCLGQLIFFGYLNQHVH